MTKIIRKGIEYSSAANGRLEAIQVTQAEWDALVQAGTLMPGARYIVIDAPNLNPTAEDIAYAEGSTTTVKDKIDIIDNEDASEIAYDKTAANPISIKDTLDSPLAKVNKYMGTAAQWFTTNSAEQTNTMTISTTSSLTANESIHVILFGRYGAWAVKVNIGTNVFSSCDITKLETASNTVNASVSGKTLTLTGVGNWSSFLGVIIKPFYPNAAFTIGQS